MILIIGYDHEWEGDGIGWQASNILRAEFALDGTVRSMPCRQLSAELCELLSRSRLTLFLGANSASIYDLTFAPIEPMDTALPLVAPYLTPGRLLSLSRRQYGSYPRALSISAGTRGALSCAGSYENNSPDAQSMLREMLSLARCVISKEMRAWHEPNFPVFTSGASRLLERFMPA